MKKTLLAVTLLTALSVSGAASAFTESVDGNFTGSLDFSGTITNDNPVWAWQIPAATIVEVKDVALAQNTGAASGANTEFVITGSSLPILEGRMTTPAPVGVAGLTPVITIGGQDMVASTCPVSQGGCEVAVSATSGGKDVGTVVTLLKSAGALTYVGMVHGQTLETPVGLDVTQAALTVLRGMKDYNVFYPTIDPSGEMTLPLLDNAISFPDLTMSSSRVVELANSKLVVPTNAIPATWAATLPITISLK